MVSRSVCSGWHFVHPQYRCRAHTRASQRIQETREGACSCERPVCTCVCVWYSKKSVRLTSKSLPAITGRRRRRARANAPEVSCCWQTRNVCLPHMCIAFHVRLVISSETGVEMKQLQPVDNNTDDTQLPGNVSEEQPSSSETVRMPTENTSPASVAGHHSLCAMNPCVPFGRNMTDLRSDRTSSQQWQLSFSASTPSVVAYPSEQMSIAPHNPFWPIFPCWYAQRTIIVA